MSMSKEDVLRELELLPVWRLKQMPALTDADTKPVIAESPQAPERVVEQLDAEKPEAAKSVEQTIQESSIAQAILKPETSGSQPQPKTVKQWAIICPLPDDKADCINLMQNIIKAMKLPAKDVVLLNQTASLDAYDVSQLFFFGIEQAQAYLKLNDEMEQLRGQAHQLNHIACWVTYHPQQMLDNPQLKRQVWQDICQALSQ